MFQLSTIPKFLVNAVIACGSFTRSIQTIVSIDFYIIVVSALRFLFFKALEKKMKLLTSLILL